MDKTGIIVVSICALLLGWWFIEQNKLAQQQARFAETNQVAKAQSQLAATNASAAATLTAAPPSRVTTPVIFDTNAPEQTIVLTNGQPHHDWARYTFTSRGGGLKLVELLDYPRSAEHTSEL